MVTNYGIVFEAATYYKIVFKVGTDYQFNYRLPKCLKVLWTTDLVTDYQSNYQLMNSSQNGYLLLLIE